MVKAGHIIIKQTKLGRIEKMALTLTESFNNIALIANAALLDKAQRVGIDESLENIAGVLRAHEVMLQAAKEEKEKPQLEDESDANED